MLNTGHSDRRAAILRARVAQAACVVMLTAAGALAILGLPGGGPTSPPEKLEVPIPDLGLKDAHTARSAGNVDSVGLGARMDLLGNAPKIAVAAVAEETGEEIVPVPPPQEARYIGTMTVGPRTLAIVTDGARQRVMKVGDVLDNGATITAIGPGELEVEANNVKSQIALAERSGASVGRATPSAVSRASVVQQPRTAAPPKGLGGRSDGRRIPGTADGSPERLDELIRQMRASQQYPDENSINQAAKEIFQAETERAEKNGGKS